MSFAGNHVRSLLSFALPDASPEHRGVGGPKFLDVSNRPHSPQGVVCDGLSPQPRRGSGARSKHAFKTKTRAGKKKGGRP